MRLPLDRAIPGGRMCLVLLKAALARELAPRAAGAVKDLLTQEVDPLCRQRPIRGRVERRRGHGLLQACSAITTGVSAGRPRRFPPQQLGQLVDQLQNVTKDRPASEAAVVSSGVIERMGSKGC